MDLTSFVMAVLLGSAAGALTGLVPGLHVNTLAAVMMVAVAAPSPAWAVGLLAVGIVHTFVSIVPATYLGAPGEDTALVTLPAHRLLVRGLGPEAVRVSARASLGAVVAVVVFVLPYKWLLLEPGRAFAWLTLATPWLLATVLAILILQEWPRVTAMAGALACVALSGVLGLVALDAAPRGWFPGSASPLLPLLSGLFGVPGLLVSLGKPAAIPRQRRGAWRHQPPGLARGVTAAAWTAVLPGLTGAVATALAQPRSHDPKRAVVALSVVNTAHAALALPVLWITGRPRTGLAQAMDRLLAPTPWTQGPPPPSLIWVLAAIVLAALLGYAATLSLDRLASSIVHRVPAQALSTAGLVMVVGLTAVLTGWLGLAILATATIVGLLPLSLGVRRVHLVGALLVPILWRSFSGA